MPGWHELEDTGKTWPVRDARCAMLTVSENIWESVYNIHTSVMLNVSPFVLNFLTEYVNDSLRYGLAAVRDVVARNRQEALRVLRGSLLVHQEPMANVSVAWFRIADENVTALALQQALVQADVYVLRAPTFAGANRVRVNSSFASPWPVTRRSSPLPCNICAQCWRDCEVKAVAPSWMNRGPYAFRSCFATSCNNFWPPTPDRCGHLRHLPPTTATSPSDGWPNIPGCCCWQAPATAHKTTRPSEF